MTHPRAHTVNRGALVGLNPARCPMARGVRRPPAATADQEELDAGMVTSLLGSSCMEVPAMLEGACCFLQGVQPVPPWDEGPCVFSSAQVSPSPLEQRKDGEDHICTQSHLEIQPLSSQDPYPKQLCNSYCPVLGNSSPLFVRTCFSLPFPTGTAFFPGVSGLQQLARCAGLCCFSAVHACPCKSQSFLGVALHCKSALGEWH